jgi:uncharacterized membrane protein
MSELLVITFPARETAGQAAERLKSVQAAHGVDITDIAVVEKDADARIHVHHGLDKPTLGGAIGGRSLGQHVDKQLIEDVEADLTADTSALFVVLTGNAAALVGALQPYAGKVYQTSLDAEVESQIKAALEKEA